MVLIFILLLAYLGRLIIAELERGGQRAAREGGDCPACAVSVEADWLLCPHCGALLTTRCDGCDGRIAAYFANCPWCGIRQNREKA